MTEGLSFLNNNVQFPFLIVIQRSIVISRNNREMAMRREIPRDRKVIILFSSTIFTRVLNKSYIVVVAPCGVAAILIIPSAV